jgi:hypothetical protein
MRRPSTLAPLAGLAAMVLGLGSVAAGAEPIVGGQDAAAQTLFDEAKTLAARQRWADACPRLEESQRLSPHMVTLYRLADCYEHIGRTASAWVLFNDAASRARDAGEVERERVARDRAAALEPTLTRLGIISEASGARITRDGVVVEPQQLGLKVPVDPGPHTIVATAPGKKSFSTVVTVSGQGSAVTVTVPPLEDERLPPQGDVVAAPTEDSSAQPKTKGGQASNDSRSRPGLAGAIIFGVGIATVATGVVLLVAEPSSTGVSCPFSKCTLPGLLILPGAVLSVTGGAIWLADVTSPKSQPVAGVSLGPSGGTFRVIF